ncbi:MAG: ComEC family competence protein [Candidatus Omnitrophica bacterium]|nr:ComEC family competence protein [Candidatus Omnitrophota bacterium]
MLKRPLILICAFYIIGIFVSSVFYLNFLFSCCCLILSYLSAVFTVRKKALFIICLGLSCFFLGYCLYPQEQNLPRNHIANFTSYKGMPVQALGWIISDPAKKKNYQSFELKIMQLIVDNKGYSVQGRVLVKLYQEHRFEYGQEIILSGKISRPYKFSYGRFDYPLYLRDKGIYSVLTVGKTGGFDFTGKNLGNPFKRIMFSLRQAQAQLIDKYLSPNAAGIMKAMLLGERSNAPRFINTALQRTGTVHILAVSGLHTGVIIFIVLILLKMIQVPYRTRYFLSIIFIVFYCVFTGGRISVIRSTIMAVVFLAGFILDRDYDTYSALAFAALLILWFIPGQIFEIGFQLSFASVLAIILFYNRIADWLYGLNLKKWQQDLLAGMGVSFCAWLGTLGLVAYYFSLISPISVAANLFIVPLLFLVIASGLLFISLGALIPALFPALALNCEFLISFIYRIAHFLSGLPGAYFNIGSIPLIWVIFYYILLFAAFFTQDLKQSVRKLFSIKV